MTAAAAPIRAYPMLGFWGDCVSFTITTAQESLRAVATTTWSFGVSGSGFYATVSFDGTNFTVTCVEGAFDLNALWFSDGDTQSGEGGTSLPKGDSSLSMGSTKVKWDDYAKISSSGLKKGQTIGQKSTYFTTGEVQIYSLSDLLSNGLDASWIASVTDWNTITLGIRATSVSGVPGTTSIKYVASSSTPPPPDTDVTPFVGPGLMRVGGCGHAATPC